MAGENMIDLTESNFEEEVNKSTIPVLIDFWAPWCGPCLRMAPMLEKLALQYKGKIKIGKLNVDENQNLAANFGIQSIPTTYIIKGGEVVDRAIGLIPQDVLEEMIKNQIE